MTTLPSFRDVRHSRRALHPSRRDHRVPNPLEMRSHGLRRRHGVMPLERLENPTVCEGLGVATIPIDLRAPRSL